MHACLLRNKRSFEEQKKARLQEGVVKIASILLSHDGSTTAFVIRSGKFSCVTCLVEVNGLLVLNVDSSAGLTFVAAYYGIFLAL
jgi:hypothetical protein